MVPGRYCAVSASLSGCMASSTGMSHNDLLCALCPGSYPADTTAHVLISTCWHSQDEQSSVSNILHLTSQSKRNHDSLPIQDDSILTTQRVADVKIQLDGFRSFYSSWLPILCKWLEGVSVQRGLFPLLHGPPVLSCQECLAESSLPSHKHQFQDQEVGTAQSFCNEDMAALCILESRIISVQPHNQCLDLVGCLAEQFIQHGGQWSVAIVDLHFLPICVLIKMLESKHQ